MTCFKGYLCQDKFDNFFAEGVFPPTHWHIAYYKYTSYRFSGCGGCIIAYFPADNVKVFIQSNISDDVCCPMVYGFNAVQ